MDDTTLMAESEEIKAREFQKNNYFCFIDYAKAFDSVDHNKLWKILKEMGIPEHLTCLLRNLYAVKAPNPNHWTTRKPKRKTPIKYTNAYIWNLERW